MVDGRPAMALLLLVVSAAVLATGPAFAAADPTFTAADPTFSAASPAFAPAQPEADGTVTRIAVAENGTATWEVQIRTRLPTEERVSDYERFQAEFRENRSRYLDPFRRSMTGVVGNAANETGREMRAREFRASTSTQVVPRRWGIVTYEFEWTNFAARDGADLVVGDVFRGQFLLTENDSLAITGPPGYVVSAAEPEPADGTAERVRWEGHRAFTEDRPSVRFEPRPTETPTPTRTPGAGGGTATADRGTSTTGNGTDGRAADGAGEHTTASGDGTTSPDDSTGTSTATTVAGDPRTDGGRNSAPGDGRTTAPGDGPGEGSSIPLAALVLVPLALVGLAAYRYYGGPGGETAFPAGDGPGAGGDGPGAGGDGPGAGDNGPEAGGDAGANAAADVDAVDAGHGATRTTPSVEWAATDGEMADATTTETGDGASDAPGSSAGVDPDPLVTDADRVRELLAKHDGQLRQGDIVDGLDWSKSKTSRVLSDMADEGTIEKLRIGRENVISLDDAPPDEDESNE